MNLFQSLTLLSVALINLNSAIAIAPVIPPQTLYTLPSEEINVEVENWLIKLKTCESGGNEKALNPKDTDGTPSKGLYQFKDKTFNWLSQKYNIATTSIWNGEEQEKIVRRMIYDKDIDLRYQFPACVRLLGLPPLKGDT